MYKESLKLNEILRADPAYIETTVPTLTLVERTPRVNISNSSAMNPYKETK